MDNNLTSSQLDKLIEVLPYFDNQDKELYLYIILDNINNNILDKDNLKRIHMLFNYIYNDLVFRPRSMSKEEFYNTKLCNKTYKEINSDLVLTHNNYIKRLKR